VGRAEPDGTGENAQPARTFTYDSLQRLRTANNPESGLTSYTYDNNGNPLSSTDARNAITNFQYDGLNRLQFKTYDLAHVAAGQTVAKSPNVQYAYDLDLREPGDAAPNFAVGRLSQVTAGVSATLNFTAMTMNRYDALGRVTASRQDVGDGPGTPYRFLYTYNQLGIAEHGVFQPAENPVELRRGGPGAECGEPERGETAVSNIQYAPHGGLKQMTAGEPTGGTDAVNTRLQAMRDSRGQQRGGAESAVAGECCGVAGRAAEPGVRLRDEQQ